MSFYPTLQQYITELLTEFEQIPETRRELLRPLGQYCKTQVETGKASNLVVICTHNSRRSHMGQLWLRAATKHYNIPNVQTYSGGTEGTAFNPRAVIAMQTAGFRISKKTDGSNPRYLTTMHAEDDGQLLFSKRYDAPPNPTKDFAPILVCTEADKGCPIILGADQRFPISYNDPKAFDDTKLEEKAYAERCRDIAREMFFALGMVS
ncbi:MAG: arsenate reductase [Polaribacter sp.]|jgi:arsenate reductase